MVFPKYISVVRNETRGSHMELVGSRYETLGWSLPLKYVMIEDGRYIIYDFMDHLNGSKLEPISLSTFNKGIWGVKATFRH